MIVNEPTLNFHINHLLSHDLFSIGYQSLPVQCSMHLSVLYNTAKYVEKGTVLLGMIFFSIVSLMTLLDCTKETEEEISVTTLTDSEAIAFHDKNLEA